jgi:hypothetical protein
MIVFTTFTWKFIHRRATVKTLSDLLTEKRLYGPHTFGTPEQPHIVRSGVVGVNRKTHPKEYTTSENRLRSTHENRIRKLHRILSAEAEQQVPTDRAWNEDSRPDLSAIMHYKDSSDSLNGYLRRGVYTSLSKNIPYLDAVTSHKTKHGFLAYRAIDPASWTRQDHRGRYDTHEILIKRFPVRAIHHDRGFTGTSISLEQAMIFGFDAPMKYGVDNSKPGVAEIGGHRRYVTPIAEINVKPGTKGHYLDTSEREYHQGHEEHEFLLHRGTAFRVTGHSFNPDTNVHLVHMDIHSQEDHR